MKILLLLLTLCLTAFATEEDKQALRNLRDVYEKAVAAGDLDALKPHLAADFTAVMITAEEVKGFDGIIAYWKKVQAFTGEGGTYRVKIDADDSIFEGSLAIAKGRALEQVTMKGGKTLEFTSLWTAVARKESGTWKLVRIHAGIDPVENPIITALAGAKRWLLLGAGGLAGLACGWLLGRRRK